MDGYVSTAAVVQVVALESLKVALLGLVAVLVWTGCGVSESSQVTGPPPDPVGLLAQRPALPATVNTLGGPEPIDWGREPGDGPVKLRTCVDGDGAFRSWSEDGIERGIPSVTQVVCVLKTPEAATETYASQSLAELAGENWPNFEPSSRAETAPSDLDSLDVLADEWEVGCGTGDPDIACSVWIFRARYGRVLMDVKFFSSPGEITFEQMRDIVTSVDAVIAHTGAS